MRKPVFGSFDLVPHKLSCTVIENGLKLEILDLGSREIALSLYRKQALISLGVNAKLISVFVFAYIQKWFSQDTAHINAGSPAIYIIIM